MEAFEKFDAPWGKLLKITTTLIVVVFSGLVLTGLLFLNGVHEGTKWAGIVLITIPLSFLAGTALFMIRSYTLSENKLFIQRLAWSSVIELEGLQAVEADPEAMKKSLLVFGNGGLFSISGVLKNLRLGSYRAFATDPKNAVKMIFQHRVVVVTPESPEAFVEHIKLLAWNRSSN